MPRAVAAGDVDIVVSDSHVGEDPNPAELADYRRTPLVGKLAHHGLAALHAGMQHFGRQSVVRLLVVHIEMSPEHFHSLGVNAFSHENFGFQA